MSDTDAVVATPAEVSASLSAGFNKARGETPAAITPNPEAQPVTKAVEAAAQADVTPPDTAVDTPAAPDEAAKEEPIAGLGLTPSEVRAQLASIAEMRAQHEVSERKLLGKLGSLKSELLEVVKSAKSEAPATVAKISRDKLKRIAAEYGDDMADALAEDLNALITAPTGTVDADALKAQFTETLNAKLAEQKLENEVRTFTRAHPDWQTLKTTDDFKLWQNALPAETRNELGSSRDADFLIDQFNRFKAWKKAADPTARKKENAARLEGNVTPQGTPSSGPAVLPDKAGLSAGFSRIRGTG